MTLNNFDDVRDTPASIELQSSNTVFTGAIWDIAQDTFTFPGEDEAMTRQYLTHPGAVAIVALDADRRVCLIRQYRHPVGENCWEIPAGLLDVPGEDPLEAARRELAEEADLRAGHWTPLVQHYPTSGSSAEKITIYLAQDLEEIPVAEQFERDGEEAHIVKEWVPLEIVVDKVLSGEIKNVNAVAGVLAAKAKL